MPFPPHSEQGEVSPRDDSPGESVNVLILGAGGAGMMCAIHAGRRGRRVLLIDHATRLGGKILISGGGRCNFTNEGAGPGNYVSGNPHFAKSAFSRFPPRSFIELVEAHGIAYHEKKLGQLFCDGSAQAIVELLRTECEAAGARIALSTKLEGVARIENPAEDAPRFRARTSRGTVECRSLVVATGGLSIPKLGATGVGYELARQFGLAIVPTAPGLDGFVFSDRETRALSSLAGLSIDVRIECGGVAFRENILFTHTGLSGPAALQASLHWHAGDAVTIDLSPDRPLFQWFVDKKHGGSRALVRNLLSELLPARFCDAICELHFPHVQPLPQVSEKALEAFCARLHAWELRPSGTVGYGKAEVTRGGVDTAQLSSKTMEAREVPGLYFIGEVVDVTGWLGGYNFQWAWASGFAAGQAV